MLSEIALEGDDSDERAEDIVISTYSPWSRQGDADSVFCFRPTYPFRCFYCREAGEIGKVAVVCSACCRVSCSKKECRCECGTHNYRNGHETCSSCSKEFDPVSIIDYHYLTVGFACCSCFKRARWQGLRKLCKNCLLKVMRQCALNLPHLQKRYQSFFKKVYVRDMSIFLHDSQNVDLEFVPADVYIYLWTCSACQPTRKTMDDRVLLLYQCMIHLNQNMMEEEEGEGEKKGIGYFELLIPDILFYIAEMFTSLIQHYGPVRMEQLDMHSLPIPKTLIQLDSRFYTSNGTSKKI